MIDPTQAGLDPTDLEDLLAEIGARLLAGERLHGAGSSFSMQVDLAAAARPLVAAGACRLGVCSSIAPGGGAARCPDPSRLGDIASAIDHTLLKADATQSEVDQLCAEAIENRFASVCVNSTWVRRCAEILQGSGVLVCTVVGFPLGAALTEVKSYEARRAIEDGACEVDMVLNVGAMKSGLMRRAVGPVVGVKASGGVRDAAAARAMLKAGATRIGASASVAIAQGAPAAAGSGY